MTHLVIDYLSKLLPEHLFEVVNLIKPGRWEIVRQQTVNYLYGLSGTVDGFSTILQHEQVMQCVIDLSNDKNLEVARDALRVLLNLSKKKRGAIEVIKYIPSYKKNVVELLISYILDPQKKDADLACMILTNITTWGELVVVCMDTFRVHLNDMINAFANVTYNQKGSNLDYIAIILYRLSIYPWMRKWLTEANPQVPLIKLMPFSNYKKSLIRIGGVFAIIRNLSFYSEYHEFLLSKEMELSSYSLMPLLGILAYVGKVTDLSWGMYLSQEKVEESNKIKGIVLDTLYNLCATRKGRDVLRSHFVHAGLWVCHKSVNNVSMMLLSRKIMEILTQKEVDADDFPEGKGPEDVKMMLLMLDEYHENDDL